MCTNVALTVVEMDPVTPSLELVIMVVKTDGVNQSVEHKNIQACPIL